MYLYLFIIYFLIYCAKSKQEIPLTYGFTLIFFIINLKIFKNNRPHPGLLLDLCPGITPRVSELLQQNQPSIPLLNLYFSVLNSLFFCNNEFCLLAKKKMKALIPVLLLKCSWCCLQCSSSLLPCPDVGPDPRAIPRSFSGLCKCRERDHLFHPIIPCLPIVDASMSTQRHFNLYHICLGRLDLRLLSPRKYTAQNPVE